MAVQSVVDQGEGGLGKTEWIDFDSREVEIFIYLHLF